jgi:LTXXQ motif family protein
MGNMGAMMGGGGMGQMMQMMGGDMMGAGMMGGGMAMAPFSHIEGRAAERTDAMVKIMSANLERMKTFASAEKALYAVLTDTQKATADELIGGPMMGMGGPMMGAGGNTK